ncbi:hypothetical protein [Actinomadura rudentiformis]|uniref:hypothetical protein n=1 Tax=Actinomadura rudentiformis TaxID=359158 RepID=UPI00178C69E4|nr:hypothetical protein [Actinomadura rudentiformis]
MAIFWPAGAPVRRSAGLLRALWIDAGNQDEYHLDAGAAAFRRMVSAAGVPDDATIRQVVQALSDVRRCLRSGGRFNRSAELPYHRTTFIPFAAQAQILIICSITVEFVSH